MPGQLPTKLPGPKGFWNILKSVSAAEIAREANRPLSIAIVGVQADRDEALRMLMQKEDTSHSKVLETTLALPETPFIQFFDSMTEEAGFPRTNDIYDFVLDTGIGREGSPEGTLVYSIAELGGWTSTLERVLDDKPELMLALARNFPVLRRKVSERIITQTASANAQFSLLTGIVAAFPLTEIIGLPTSAISDIIVLTKNQAMMVLRLAAIHGLDVDYKSRFKELAPVLGNAFGWRAIARELVSIIPLGFIFKATIAYAGTVTVGKAAQFYYETGSQITAAQARKLYQEAFAASRSKVRSLADAMRRGRRKGAVDKGEGTGGKRSRTAIASQQEDLHDDFLIEPTPQEENELPDRYKSILIPADKNVAKPDAKS